MKKIAVFALVVGLSIFVAGCKKTNQNDNQDQGAIQKQEKGGVVSSIKDAMGLGKKVKCTYRYAIAGQTDESVVYIEGKKYKSSYEIEGQKTNNFFDGEISYTWTEGQKTGTKISMACLKEIGDSYKSEEKNTGQNQNQLKAGQEAFENAVDTKCEPTNEDISLPIDITFTDQCDQMKGQIQSMQEMMKKYQNMGQGAGQ
ncbi:MAG: hypothetical protein NT136_04210 [Candidatus Moranbacteria bacterium]|nr:hypothetical protein [Candidatus Moranbacteria bacterium]